MIRTQKFPKIAEPIYPAVAPKVRNITDKPALKASEFAITARREFAAPSFKWSTLTPDIKEMYPGTRGKTHGDRNDSSPPANAITILKNDIPIFYFGLDSFPNQSVKFK